MSSASRKLRPSIGVSDDTPLLTPDQLPRMGHLVFYCPNARKYTHVTGRYQRRVGSFSFQLSMGLVYFSDIQTSDSPRSGRQSIPDVDIPDQSIDVGATLVQKEKVCLLGTCSRMAKKECSAFSCAHFSSGTRFKRSYKTVVLDGSLERNCRIRSDRQTKFGGRGNTLRNKVFDQGRRFGAVPPHASLSTIAETKTYSTLGGRSGGTRFFITNPLISTI